MQGAMEVNLAARGGEALAARTHLVEVGTHLVQHVLQALELVPRGGQL